MGRGRGRPSPIAHGYEQHGEFDARIELTEGVLELVGPAHRVHVWGAPYLPQALAMPVDERRVCAGPIAAATAINVDQVLTPNGWLGRTIAG